MNKFSLYVLSSNHPVANREATLQSVEGLDYILQPDIYYTEAAKTFSRVTTKWALFLYDNEYVTEELKEALPVFFEVASERVLVLYKWELQDGKKFMSRAPRGFQRDITLSHESMKPEEECSHTHVLNGWLIPHDSSGPQSC